MKCPTCESESVLETPVKGMENNGQPRSEYTCEYGHVWIGPCACHNWQNEEKHDASTTRS